MQYYGNLALREERKPEKQPQQRGPAPSRQSPQPRRRHLPVGEKLIYLFTVALLVGVTGLVIYRSAGLYEMNREIQKMTGEYEQAVDQSRELQREVDRLMDPAEIARKAQKLGLQKLDQQPITLSADKDQTASQTKP
ncbi:cell division protein FtsL [Cohnella nanjingensis]|uniref:Cell division initiation protein n=1 Tax=Cohnella nanjingensis TaxID=1387779 RepID=A0A7X0RT62_9BACL|nr:cell division initiation protein [Cohnella nanjingensis]MBB6673227.1 cell division initiation protein [Cohnella nanjingensis]